MEKSNNTVKIIGALLLGTAVGGALGILFAPAKGSKTRRKILAQRDELTDALKENFSDFLGELKKEFKAVNEKANDLLENGVAKASQFK